jgi:hypothetical protein
MKHSVAFLLLASLSSTLAACAADDGPGDGNDFASEGTGAAVSTGGDSTTTGGSTTSSGGLSSTGGLGSGGVATGGNLTTGGTVGSGGESATGGLVNTGGSEPGTGGVVSTGGTVSTGGVANTGGTGGTGGGEQGPQPLSCSEPFEDPADYTSGLPLLQSNPNAGLVLYVDYDGGNYGGSEPLTGYYTGTASQRQNIVKSFNYLVQYFAMFDLSITTDVSKIGAGSDALNWGWAVVTPDISGGSGKYNGIGKPTYGMAKCGSATMTNNDRSRRIAHELGHNMNLYHDGLFEVPSTQDLSTGADTAGDTCTASDALCFFKFEDSKGWDGQYGSIMGGGGEGVRNGWGLALFDPEHGGTNSQSNLQDSMAKIRKVVRELGASTANDGWALDDHPDAVAAPLCIDANDALYRVGVLGSPTDVDVFSLNWSGGTLNVTWSAPGVSAALVDLDIYKDGQKVGDSSVANASSGTYQIRVKSTGAYGAIGYYRIDIL